MEVNAQTFIVHTIGTEQADVLKTICNALKIKFEVSREKPYNTDFVNMVLQAEEGIMKGKGKKVSSEEFDLLWK